MGERDEENKKVQREREPVLPHPRCLQFCSRLAFRKLPWSAPRIQPLFLPSRFSSVAVPSFLLFLCVSFSFRATSLRFVSFRWQAAPWRSAPFASRLLFSRAVFPSTGLYVRQRRAFRGNTCVQLLIFVFFHRVPARGTAHVRKYLRSVSRDGREHPCILWRSAPFIYCASVTARTRCYRENMVILEIRVISRQRPSSKSKEKRRDAMCTLMDRLGKNSASDDAGWFQIVYANAHGNSRIVCFRENHGFISSFLFPNEWLLNSGIHSFFERATCYWKYRCWLKRLFIYKTWRIW